MPEEEAIIHHRLVTAELKNGTISNIINKEDIKINISKFKYKETKEPYQLAVKKNY